MKDEISAKLDECLDKAERANVTCQVLSYKMDLQNEMKAVE
jgi:hypothetical protein